MQWVVPLSGGVGRRGDSGPLKTSFGKGEDNSTSPTVNNELDRLVTVQKAGKKWTAKDVKLNEIERERMYMQTV